MPPADNEGPTSPRPRARWFVRHGRPQLRWAVGLLDPAPVGDPPDTDSTEEVSF